MKMKSLAMLAALLLPMTALAADGDMHGSMSGHDMSGMHHDMGEEMSEDMPMEGMSQNMYLKKAEVDGYTVSFHVMPAAEGMQHGGSHNMMVKVERDGKPVEIVKANSKVITSDGRAESKKMVKMGDWQMAGYNLGHEGQHQLMVLFKTTDDQKHFVGVYYPGKP